MYDTFFSRPLQKKQKTQNCEYVYVANKVYVPLFENAANI